MAKVSFVPDHYSFNLDPVEYRDLLIALRTFVREYNVMGHEEEILAAMEEKYQGELGQPPGPPIDPDEPDGGSAVPVGD